MKRSVVLAACQIDQFGSDLLSTNCPRATCEPRKHLILLSKSKSSQSPLSTSTPSFQGNSLKSKQCDGEGVFSPFSLAIRPLGRFANCGDSFPFVPKPIPKFLSTNLSTDLGGSDHTFGASEFHQSHHLVIPSSKPTSNHVLRRWGAPFTMARIRTIKPEFWKDGKVMRLSEPCALFFIGLWNFCDDEGKCRNDSFELASNMPRFKSQHISKWIQILFEAGLVQLSTDFRWISVTNWNHQKIDRPRLPQVPKSEIEWLPVFEGALSANARRMIDDASTNVRRKDRIGKDRIVPDRNSVRVRSAKTQKSEPLEMESESPPAGAQPLAAAVPRRIGAIERYYELWLERYQDRAPLLAVDHKKLKDLEREMGVERSIRLVEAFFSMPDSWFVSKRHDVQSLMSNLTKVQHFVATGSTVTRRDADAIENSQALQNQLQRLGGGV